MRTAWSMATRPWITAESVGAARIGPSLMPSIDAGREVIGQHLDLVREAAVAQQADGGFGGRRGADDVFDVGIGLEHVLDQLELHFLAGVAVFGLDDLDVRCP